LRIFEELLRRGLLQDRPEVHEDDPVGDLPGEPHFVRDHDHRHPGDRKILHDLENLADHLGVEGRCRLVEEHDLRVHRQPPGDRHALLLAAGELGRVGVPLLGQADTLEERERLFLRLLPALVADLHGSQRDVLEDREVRVEVELLEDEADLRPHLVDVGLLVREVRSVDDQLPLVDRFEVVDRPDEGGLPRAGRSADHDDLARPHMKVDVVQHVQLAEPFVDALEPDHRASPCTCRAAESLSFPRG
jgi:hypothetical protein